MDGGVAALIEGRAQDADARRLGARRMVELRLDRFIELGGEKSRIDARTLAADVLWYPRLRTDADVLHCPTFRGPFRAAQPHFSGDGIADALDKIRADCTVLIAQLVGTTRSTTNGRKFDTPCFVATRIV